MTFCDTNYFIVARCNRVKAIKNHFTAYEDFKKKFGEFISLTLKIN